jgi:hypothetical protein
VNYFAQVFHWFEFRTFADPLEIAAQLLISKSIPGHWVTTNNTNPNGYDFIDNNVAFD